MNAQTKRMTNEEAVKYLKSRFKDLLENDLGIEDTNKPFQCINPEHADVNPFRQS